MQIPLIKGDSVDSNVDYRDALPVNMYGVNKELLGAKGYLLNWYGLTLFSEGQGIDRGGIWVSRDGFEGHYRVSGNSLIKVDQNGNTTALGDIPGSEQVSMDYSFNNLSIVADGRLYYYNPTDGFREIIDPQVGSPIDIVWVDGYFFLTDGESIFHSNIANEEEYEPLDFANAEFSPDPSKGLGKNEQNEVLVFGAFSVEYFVNVGAENFAFQRIQRKAQKIGILGTHCKQEMNGKWYTLSRRKESSPSFHIISLGSEQSISTRETDQILSEYSDDDLSITTVDTIVRENSKFVLFHLPNHCLVFNESVAETLGLSNAWFILKTDVLGDATYRAKNFVRDDRNGKWLAGDKRNSNIGELDKSICTHYGDIVEWLLYTPFVKIETLSIDKMEVEHIPGISPDNDATVFFSITTNGRTYTKEYTKEYGLQWDYRNRFYCHRLGYIRDWFAFKFRGVSRSRMAFANLQIEAS